MNLLPDERRQQILRLLDQHGRVLATDLAVQFTTSEDTIRRDLREMDRAGLLRRVHGGATKAARSEAVFEERKAVAPARKNTLATAARSLVKREETVLIDGGSTNLAIAQALPDGLAAAIITNSPDIAVALRDMRRTQVVLLGGTIRYGSGAAGGAHTLGQVGKLRPDLCFLGACSIDAQAGLCASDPDEAVLKRAMAKVSRRVATAVLTDRLLSRSAFHVIDLTELDHLVVETSVPSDLMEAFGAVEGGPQIITAGAFA